MKHAVERRRGAGLGAPVLSRSTGRRVSIEYALIRDINDHERGVPTCWREAQRARPWLGALQPDPAEPHAGLQVDGERSPVEQEFVARLRAHGIPTTIRDTAE